MFSNCRIPGNPSNMRPKCLDADIHVMFACARCGVLCHGGVPVSSFDRKTSVIVFGYAMPSSSFFFTKLRTNKFLLSGGFLKTQELYWDAYMKRFNDTREEWEELYWDGIPKEPLIEAGKRPVDHYLVLGLRKYFTTPS